ncbi:RNA polymerase II degradation factor 1-like [Drosophila miranda]|uniref:RNA polymerase II degradation factor 1-like n=1 Tax=Drosophila miranda TaxID=7229 RepID=UPI00143F97ED|nr:RNA polymerase II degradation factor 1-like [Drosophila miranda]
MKRRFEHEETSDSGEEVELTDGARAPTAAEKARWRQQRRADPDVGAKKPLTLRDRFEAVKRRFLQAMPEEKRRIHRVLEAALAMSRRKRERKEALRRQAEEGTGTKKPGEESDEAPPPPPFRVVLPPMQPQAEEPEAKGAQTQATGELPGSTQAQPTDPESEWQRRLQQAEEEEEEMWQPTPQSEDDEGPARHEQQAEEEEQQNQQQQWQRQGQQHQQQQWQQWRGPEAAVMGPYVSQEVRTAVRQGMVWHHQTLHITWASGPAPCEAQPEAGARVWEEPPRGSNSRDPRRRDPGPAPTTGTAEADAAAESAATAEPTETAATETPAAETERAEAAAAEAAATATAETTAVGGGDPRASPNPARGEED